MTAATAVAAAPLTATLALMPPTTLPGIPVSFLITVTNPSEQDLTIGCAANLTVTTSSGTFQAQDATGRTAIGFERPECRNGYRFTIPAQGQRQICFDVDRSLTGNPFGLDPRLSFPGSYGVTMTLYAAADFNQPFSTNTATLTVRQPAGVDASVWAHMLSVTHGRGWGAAAWVTAGDALATWVRSNDPTSSYAMWLAGRGGVTSYEETLARYDQALTANPPEAFRDDLLWAKGNLLDSWSNDALRADRDADKALSLADSARATLRLLRDVAVTDLLRQEAADRLPHLVTREGALAELRMLAEGDPPAPAHLAPRVECVTKGAGQTFRATFGYSNPNRAIKVLQIGADNQVTPAPREQGQPRVFKPGNHASVFTAASPGGELIWHLDGATAVATADFPVPCPVAGVSTERTK